MNKILLIIQREYLVRVRKKSFIVMTLLTPVLFAVFYGVVIWLAIDSNDHKTVQIIDESGLFVQAFKSDKNTAYVFLKRPLVIAKKNLIASKANALVFIPNTIAQHPEKLVIYAEKSVGLPLQNGIEHIIQSELENRRLIAAGIDRKILEATKIEVNASTYNLSEEGNETNSSSLAASIMAYLSAFLLYLFIMVYGTQVMMSVLEEKTSRVIEVIVSSVRPIELMLGKILGMSLVALTQFLLWITLTFAINATSTFILGFDRFSAQKELMATTSHINKDQVTRANNAMATQLISLQKAVTTLPIGTIIGCFLFYFLFGYLLYSSLFAAIGASVESQAETQQFTMPIMLPIIASIMIAQIVLQNPDSSLAFWASMIPFTSPVIMMVRVPFGVPAWELALSMSLLVLCFVGCTWVASKIYRVGILMYGKKITWKELSKWLFYKA